MRTEPWMADVQHQAAMDRWAEHFPICSRCGHRIWPHGIYYKLDAGKDVLTVCDNCASEMMENPYIVEDVSYGN